MDSRSSLDSELLRTTTPHSAWRFLPCSSLTCYRQDSCSPPDTDGFRLPFLNGPQLGDILVNLEQEAHSVFRL